MHHQRLVTACALVASVGGVAFAQQATSGGEPFDVNQVRPSAEQPGSDRGVSVPRPQVLPEGTPDVTYAVSRFLIEYRSEHPQQPSVEQLLESRVTLSVTPEAMVEPRTGVPTTTMRLVDVADGNRAVFSARALALVARGVVEQLNAQGLGGVVVQVHPDDVDPDTGVDKRTNQSGDLRLLVWTGVVSQVRTIAGGERFESLIERDLVDRIDTYDTVHDRVREQSPAKVGELMNKRQVDEFVHRLNRHPGRRVDVVVGPGQKDQDIVLDYLINESKPWTLYGQISNTGTENTSEWRERFGFVHNQLSGNDDVLRLDYLTGGFKDTHALSASYEFPVRSDVLRVKLYGSFSEFDASEVGLGSEDFTGQTYQLGAEAIYNFYQNRNLFIDGVAGVRWQSVKVTNDLLLQEGQEQFASPYIGARLERVSDVAQTFAGVTIEAMISDLTGVDTAEIQNLGRPNVNDNWQIIRADVSHAFYIEPLVSDVFKGTGDTGRTTLAHEVGLSARGQHSFNSRVIPNEQDVAGGMFSVRGYPESVVAGDTVLIASAEYRYHVPRAWKTSPPGYVGDKRMPFFGEDFRWTPQEAFGRADWDLILKGFIDFGLTDVSAPSAGEDSYSLVGAGVGVELQIKRNLTARLEWGFALSDVDAPGNQVDSGDNRVHFLLTAAY